MSPDSSDLDRLEERLNALRPRACGCVHELESAVRGHVVFCPLSVRKINSACFHKPFDEVLNNIVRFSQRIDLITSDECTSLLRQLHDADKALEMIDLDAQVRCEELVEIEGVPAGPLGSHPQAQLTRERQRTHVETHTDVIALLKNRLQQRKGGSRSASLGTSQ